MSLYAFHGWSERNCPDCGGRENGQAVLRGGFNAHTLAAESLQGSLLGSGGAGTHERIMSLIHRNSTHSLNMTVEDLLSHPSMRGRRVGADVIDSCIDDYWTQGWKEQLDAVDRSLYLSPAFLLYGDRPVAVSLTRCACYCQRKGNQQGILGASASESNRGKNRANGCS